MSGLTPFDPFSELRALQKQFFGDDWDAWSAPLKGLQLPTTDVYTKDDNELVVEAHLPNFDQKDVNISVENGVLEVQAEKHEQEKDKSKKYVTRESSSSFYRRIRLPERAEAGSIQASMDSGVLKITIPLKALPEPKRIQIQAGKSKSSKK